MLEPSRSQIKLEPGAETATKQINSTITDTVKSSVTTPLFTENISCISNDDTTKYHVPRGVEQKKVEQALNRRLSRRTCKREADLQEINFGIDFTKLKNSPDEQYRLRQVLKENQKNLHQYVKEGSAPVFGYPPICFSPPESERQA